MKKLKEYSLIVRYKGYEEEIIGDVSRVFHVPEPGYLYVNYDDPDESGLLFKDLKEYAIQKVREWLEDAIYNLTEYEREYQWCTLTPEEERDRRFCEYLKNEGIPEAKSEVEKWKLILKGLETGEAELTLVED